MSNAPTDPYKILGIDPDASPEEIRRAYHKMALKYHPDQGGDVWAFQQVKDAYDVLTGESDNAHEQTEEYSNTSGEQSQVRTRPEKQEVSKAAWGEWAGIQAAYFLFGRRRWNGDTRRPRWVRKCVQYFLFTVYIWSILAIWVVAKRIYAAIVVD